MIRRVIGVTVYCRAIRDPGVPRVGSRPRDFAHLQGLFASADGCRRRTIGPTHDRREKQERKEGKRAGLLFESAIRLMLIAVCHHWHESA